MRLTPHFFLVNDCDRILLFPNKGLKKWPGNSKRKAFSIVKEPFSPHSRTDILILGGGVIGLFCAYYLNQAGFSVRVIERKGIGESASAGNCGIIFPSFISPLCEPGVIFHEIRRMLEGNSPLYIHPVPEIRRTLWLMNFAMHCTERHRNHAMGVKARMLEASDALYREIFKKEPIRCEYEQRGILIVYNDPQEMAGYHATNERLKHYGLAARLIEGKELQNLEPALSTKVAGAWYHGLDSHLRPDALLIFLKKILEQRGVRIEEHSPMDSWILEEGRIRGVNTAKGPFFTSRAVVLSAGAWSTAISKPLGIPIPMEPGKGYAITMGRPSPCAAHPLYLHERNVVVTPWESGVRLGGTMEFSGFSLAPNPRRVKALATAASEYLISPLAAPVETIWTGLRPMTFDDLPIIGKAPGWRNLFVATGHGMLGLSMAPATGKLVADTVTGRSSFMDPAPFSLERFR